MISPPEPPSRDEGGASSLGPDLELGARLEVPGVPASRRVYSATRRGVLGFARDVTVHVLSDLDEAAEAAFVERARGAVALSHAGVLRVLGLGRGHVDGKDGIYVAFEGCDAEPLAALSARASETGRTMPLAVAYTIGAAIAEVLDHAHRRGVVHGGLDARTVLVGREGTLRIAEFGLAKAGERAADLDALAALLTALGMPQATRDELFGGSGADARTDAGDLSDELAALAFRTSPAPAGRSVADWVATTREGSDPAEAEPAATAAWVRLSGPPAAVGAALAELERAGADVRDAAGGVATFSDADVADVETALRLARAVTANGEVAAAVVTAPMNTASSAPFDGPLAHVPAGNVWVSAPVADAARASFVFSTVAGGTGVLAAAGERAVAGAGKFVGRLDELAWLARALGNATEHGPVRVRVVGPAGIGKTRLLAELARRANRGGARAHVVRFALATRGPLGAAAAVWRELGGTSTEIEETSRHATELARLLESCASAGPCVICLDDLHLADAESVELFDAAVAAVTPGTRVLVVDSLRGEGGAGAASLALGELSDDDVAQLVATRLGARLVPPELFEPVVARTGGHPLFLEEALRDLVAQALVDVQRGVARLREGADVRLPPSFEALARSRIARLEPASRRVLAAAVVSGPGAPPERVAMLAGLPAGSEKEILWQLVQGGFARSDEAGGLHVAAVHAEAVLELVGRADEVALHLAAARSLATSSTPEELALRAEHLERSGEHADAALARLSAARALVAAGNPVQAAGHLTRALGGLESAADIEVAALELSDLCALHSIHADVEDALEHAIEVLDASATEAARASVRLRLARLLPSAPESAWVLLDGAAATAGHDAGELARARVAVARSSALPARGIDAARWLVGAVDSDGPSLRDAAEIAVWAAEPELARGALARMDGASPCARRLLGDVLLLEGKQADAEAELSRALRTARSMEDREEVARTALAYAQVLRHDAGRRFAVLSEASRAARATGDRELVELAAMHLDAFSAADDPASAERLERRVAAARARGSTLGTLVGAALSAEVGGASRASAGALANEASSIGHERLARRLRAADVAGAGGAS